MFNLFTRMFAPVRKEHKNVVLLHALTIHLCFSLSVCLSSFTQTQNIEGDNIICRRMDETAPAFPKEMKNIYKSKLQEFCHRKKWAPPRYSCMKDGPDHIPLFKASVVVNGLNFDTLQPCKSRKEADNEVAKLAFLHFSSGLLLIWIHLINYLLSYLIVSSFLSLILSLVI